MYHTVKSFTSKGHELQEDLGGSGAPIPSLALTPNKSHMRPQLDCLLAYRISIQFVGPFFNETITNGSYVAGINCPLVAGFCRICTFHIYIGLIYSISSL